MVVVVMLRKNMTPYSELIIQIVHNDHVNWLLSVVNHHIKSLTTICMAAIRATLVSSTPFNIIVEIEQNKCINCLFSILVQHIFIISNIVDFPEAWEHGVASMLFATI